MKTKRIPTTKIRTPEESCSSTPPLMLTPDYSNLSHFEFGSTDEPDRKQSLRFEDRKNSGSGSSSEPDRHPERTEARARALSRRMSFTDDDHVKACVRVRPFTARELSTPPPGGLRPCVAYEGRVVKFCNPIAKHLKGAEENEQVQAFTFDHVFWSIPPSAPGGNPTYDDQETVFDVLGWRVLEHVFRGYNTCIMAYGQTGSGKTHTMTGPAQLGGGAVTNEERGLIPRLCQELFARIDRNEEELESEEMLQKTFRVDVKFMEIYMERVCDLLANRPRAAGHFNDSTPKERHHLKVRLHPITGPFVEGLLTFSVTTWEECLLLLKKGQEQRATAATKMNDVSSRSHAVFKMTLTQTTRIAGQQSTRSANLNLVDLAGSERVSRSGVTGEQLAEAAKVNQSLSTLRKVIDALQSQKKLVPYRESVLTWVLADSLGGNSRTMLVAAISPHPLNADETLSTLVYANKARSIINQVTINEDNTASIISEMQQALADMKNEMDKVNKKAGDEEKQAKIDELQVQIQVSEKAIREMQEETMALERKYERQLTNLLTDIEERDKQQEELMHTQRRLELQAAQLEAELRREEEARQEMARRRGSLAFRYADLSNEFSKAQRFGEEAVSQLSFQEKRLINVARDLKSTKLHLQASQKEINSLKKLLKISETEKQALQDKLLHLEKNSAAHKAQVQLDSWKRRAELAEEEADRLNTEVAQHLAHAKSMEKALAEEQAKRKQEQKERFTEEVLRGKYAEQQEDLRAAMAELRAKDKELQEALNTIATLREGDELKRVQVEELEAALSSERQRWSEEMLRHREELAAARRAAQSAAPPSSPPKPSTNGRAEETDLSLGLIKQKLRDELVAAREQDREELEELKNRCRQQRDDEIAAIRRLYEGADAALRPLLDLKTKIENALAVEEEGGPQGNPSPDYTRLVNLLTNFTREFASYPVSHLASIGTGAALRTGGETVFPRKVPPVEHPTPSKSPKERPTTPTAAWLQNSHPAKLHVEAPTVQWRTRPRTTDRSSSRDSQERR